MNQQEEFLKGLEDDQAKGVDILEQPFESTQDNSEKEKPEVETNEDTHDLDVRGVSKPKNRRERRLAQKLQEERESSIFLAGKLEARKEAEKTLTQESDYLKAVERIYGTDSPEAQLATDLLKKAIIGARDDAKKEALSEIREERKREKEEVLALSKKRNSILEDIEDTYDVTLNEAQEDSFFKLLDKMSPKTPEGKVIEYADAHAVWEVFQERIQKRGTDNRAKNLSARSMVQSGASKESTLVDDSHARFLRESGII